MTETVRAENGPRELEPCPREPRCVSSRSADPARFIEPLVYDTEGARAWQAVKRLMNSRPRTRLVEDGGDYLSYECRTRIWQFRDDVTFLHDPARKVIHVRSASRIGYYDFGTNRRRIESIRRDFAARLEEGRMET